jgi:hypothetical protein
LQEEGLQQQGSLREAMLKHQKELQDERLTSQAEIQKAKDDAAKARAELSIGNRPIQIDREGRPWVLNPLTQQMEQIQGDARFPIPHQGGGDNEARNARYSTQLQSRYQANPIVKDAYGVANAISGVQSALRGDSPMSDLQTVYSVIKLFDPNSVVRNEEIKLTRSANSLPGKAQLLLANWQKGRILTPDMRQQINDLLEERIQGQERQVQPIQREFGGQARRYGVQADSSFIAPTPFEGLTRGKPSVRDRVNQKRAGIP